MRSFTHENRILRWILVVVTLLTVIQVPELLGETLLNGARLGTFPKPDFRTNFTLKSNQGSGSYKEIHHGLNSDPFYVRVYAKPTGGNNSGFCFNGIGSSQSSPSKSSFGGLIFAYNSEFVRIWAPSDLKGHVVFVKDGWGGEVNTQESNEAEVVVEVWKDGPAPTFQIEHIIDTRRKEPNDAYLLIDHELRQLPERVVVRMLPLETTDAESNPNKGFWFHGIASSQNPDPTNNFGGVIFAYNERWVRLWAPDGFNQTTGCIFVGEEWAGQFNTQKVKRCKVEILLWANQLPVPTFQSDWFGFRGQRDQHSFAEIYHGLNLLPSLAIVQIKALNDMNIGYVFEAQGATQSDDDSFNEYGGVVFAYDKNTIRIWAPSKHDGSKKGYPILVKNSWGYGSNPQKGGFVNVEIRVVLYATKCNSSTQVLYEGDHCITALYNSYKILSSWSKCSSICNNGTQKRLLTGCQVAVRKPVLSASCDFEDGMCGWTSASANGAPLKWVRTNTSTPASNTGPLWGHPKGSFYIYTNTTNAAVSQQASLTSPNIGGAGNCYFRFFWNMYGSDVGMLAVHVNTKDPLVTSYPKWSEPRASTLTEYTLVTLNIHLLPQ
ncbi:uncharacterized protein LOC111341691 [Stylophora pistillata]|uniref:uncharacterized protein LOC111341691 n=1 Tax=Stylophora pistillata TaxID=50429 RepID=UPI000C043C42|nr:uncharacterized protein LOC111341691 [Stylophora pistillata]